MYYIHENEQNKNVNFEKNFLKEDIMMDNDYVYVVMVIPRKEVEKKTMEMNQKPLYNETYQNYYPNVRYY